MQRYRMNGQALAYQDAFSDRTAKRHHVIEVDGKFLCTVYKNNRPPPGYNWDKGRKVPCDNKVYTATERTA